MENKSLFKLFNLTLLIEVIFFYNCRCLYFQWSASSLSAIQMFRVEVQREGQVSTCQIYLFSIFVKYMSNIFVKYIFLLLVCQIYLSNIFPKGKTGQYLSNIFVNGLVNSKLLHIYKLVLLDEMWWK